MIAQLLWQGGSSMSKVLRRTLGTGVIVSLLGVLYVFEGCTESNFKAVDPLLSTASNSPIVRAQEQCRFIGPDLLKYRLSAILRIPGGDVPVLNDNGQPTGDMRIASSQETLGKGDPSQGILDDYTCS